MQSWVQEDRWQVHTKCDYKPVHSRSVEKKPVWKNWETRADATVNMLSAFATNVTPSQRHLPQQCLISSAYQHLQCTVTEHITRTWTAIMANIIPGSLSNSQDMPLDFITELQVDSHVNAAARSGDAQAACRKSAKYDLLVQTGHLFQPIAVETLGPLNESSIAFFSELGRKIHSVWGDSWEPSFIFQCWITVKRFDSSLLHNSSPSDDDNISHNALLNC